jgi:branched-chain amino acid transport system substrate-binding protein
VTRSFRSPLAAACAVLLLASTLPARGGAAPEPIRIGAILSYSGPSAPLGIPQVNALKLAETEINAHGGVAGRPIHFDIVDDGAKPDVAAQLATQMVSSGVAAIICGTRVVTTDAAARVTSAAGVLQVYLTPGAEAWHARDGSVVKNVFEAAARDQLEAQALLHYARTKLHAKSIAILHDENLYGTNGAKIVGDQARADGMTVLGEEAYPGTATDFTPQIVRLREAKADILILWGATQTPALATRAARTLGIKTPILGSSGILSPAFVNVAGSAADDVYSAANLDFKDPSAQQRALADAYQKAYNERIVAFAAQAWDGAHIIAEAIAAAHGKTDGASLQAALERGTPIHGVQGTFRFSPTDHNGLGADDVHIVVARNGAWTSP